MNTLTWTVIVAEDDPARGQWADAASAAGVAAPRFVPWPSALAADVEFRPGESVFCERIRGWALTNPVGGQRARYEEFAAALEQLAAVVEKAGATLATSPEPTLLALDRVKRDEFLRDSGLPVLELSDVDAVGHNILRSRFAAADDWMVDGWHTTLYSHRTRTGFEVWRAPEESSAADLRQIYGILAADGVHAVAELHRVHLNSDFHDLRFALVDGKVTHAAGVVRERIIAREWYGGRRRELDNFLERFGTGRWERVVALAERAATQFPGIRSLGVDLIMDNSDSEYVFDVNPFGAHLPGAVGIADTVGEGLSVKAAVLRALSATS